MAGALAYSGVGLVADKGDIETPFGVVATGLARPCSL